MLQIRHPCSSSPAVLRCAVVCALLVCVGVAQGERKKPPLALALNRYLAACDVLSCCCLCTQSTMLINPSILNRSAQPQYAQPLPLLLPNADRVLLVLPPATMVGTLLPLHSFACRRSVYALHVVLPFALRYSGCSPVHPMGLPCGPQHSIHICISSRTCSIVVSMLAPLEQMHTT